MASEILKVNHELLAQAASRLDGHADSIPEPPAGFTVSGSDALSAAIAEQVPSIESPIVGP